MRKHENGIMKTPTMIDSEIISRSRIMSPKHFKQRTEREGEREGEKEEIEIFSALMIDDTRTIHITHHTLATRRRRRGFPTEADG